MNYFPKSELTCKCGCGLCKFSPFLLKVINEIRRRLGRALIAQSACRCIPHNKAEGGEETSDHLPNEDGICEGIDLKAIHSHTRYIVISTALEYGITRIGGRYKTFIHLGIAERNPKEVIW